MATVQEIHKTLQVHPSSLRRITISKIEQRNEQKRLSTTKYSVYTITCTPPVIKGIDIEVCRRYNDFRWLRKLFIECFPAIYIPPIPPPQTLGRFDKTFTEQRKKELERFLNRICSIKPLSESLIFILFLSKPENIFNVSKNEMIRAHIPSTKQKIHQLTKLFPSFCIHDKAIKQYIDSIDVDLNGAKYRKTDTIIQYKQSADAIIFGAQIKESFVFLKKVCHKMSALCEIAKKINGKLLKIKQCSKQFHEAFWRLNSSKNPLIDSERLPKFGDDKRDFYGWYNYNKEVYAIEQGKVDNLKRQHMDIRAFMDLFANRNKYLSQFENVKLRNEKWQNLIDSKYHLQPHQITQIQIDFKQEKLLRYLLLIMTKVIVNYNVYELWDCMMRDFKDMMAKYAQQQLMTHQVLYAECYNEDDGKEEGDDVSVDDNDAVECYEYEPVFGPNDDRKYSHRIQEDEEEKKNGVFVLLNDDDMSANCTD